MHVIVCGWNILKNYIQVMAICSFSTWGNVIMLYWVVLTFESVSEELECKNFIKTYCAVLSCMWSAD